MERRVIWLCGAVGSIVGGYVPALWGGSELSLGSLALGVVGGVVGIVVGARIANA
jgi:uncharacterized membrane protein YeaQ/YmgE (transglycosylase-associated protein family)